MLGDLLKWVETTIFLLLLYKQTAYFIIELFWCAVTSIEPLKDCFPFSLRIIEYHRISQVGSAPLRIIGPNSLLLGGLPKTKPYTLRNCLCSKDQPCSGQCIPLPFRRAQCAAMAGPNPAPRGSSRPSLLVVNTPLGLAAELSSAAGNWE